MTKNVALASYSDRASSTAEVYSCLLYTSEAQIAYYTMDESIFDAMRKDIAVRVNWQNSDGVIPTTAPNTFRHNEYSELTGQSLAGVMSWFTYYLYSGDRVTLEQAYPCLLYTSRCV